MKKFGFLILLIFLISCSTKSEATITKERLPTIEEMEYQPPEKILNVDLPQGEITYLPEKLTTEDNVKIAYTYNKVSDKVVILVHMLNKNKESWNDFASKLQENGISTIAIDLRGHGNSDGDWEDFSEKDFNNMVLDVKAAKKFLEEQGFAEFYVIGASIGANTALRYAASDSSIKRVILLSPSENYRGVTTLDILNDYKGKLMIVTGTQDEQSYSGSLNLDAAFNGEKELLVYDTSSHGTNLLEDYPDLNDKIIEFLKD